MRSIESESKTETKLKRIRWLSEQDTGKVFHHLMHLFSVDALSECFDELDGKKAVGADGIDKEMYRENLDENLRILVDKMKRMEYLPGPVRQVLIPKAGNPNEKRPLGIGNFEDKIVQRMMQKVLESVYDPLFLKCSYGFRAGIGCHDAIKDLHSHLFRQEEVSTIIDIDLANFFGTIDHKEVINILREKIEDERFLRYIVRMFKGGVLANGELTMSEEGVVQGSSCSPIISNIFAHYVIDVWFEKMVKSHCNGKVELFRYADDAIMCCQFESDAIRIKSALSKRLSKFKLKLNEEKTTVTSFSRRKYEEGKKQGVFHFLGFTFFWGRSRKGKALPKVETRGKSLRSKLKGVNEWARQIRNKYRLSHIWKIFGSKIRGHIQYFGVSFNTERVKYFVFKAIKILYKWLNRRSQRKSFNWEKFNLFVEKNPLPKIKVYHPFF